MDLDHETIGSGCDGAQSLTPEMFDHLMKKVDKAADFFHSLC